MEPKMQAWKMMFIFNCRWFVGSILIFRLFFDPGSKDTRDTRDTTEQRGQICTCAERQSTQ